MSKKFNVDHDNCLACGKHGFLSERDAAKALGKSITRRARQADVHGTRRGMYRENRYYECSAGYFHLTSMPRRAVRA